MSDIIMMVAGVVVGSGMGAGGFAWYKQFVQKQKLQKAKNEADAILNRAKQEAARLEQTAKNKARDFEQQQRKKIEQDLERQKKSLQQQEQSYKNKEQQLDRQYKQKESQLDQKLAEIKERDEKIRIAEAKAREAEERAEQQREQLKNKLEVVSNMSADEAKKQLVEAVQKEAQADASRIAAVIENEAKAEAEKRAKRIISMAIARYSGEYVTERTVSVIALPSEEMKGKIIGREGRNIRALEAACGVDLIIDDTPEAVVISGFDPVRREVARRSLEILMEDGRIHPARIEEVIDKTKSQLFKSIQEDGEKACFDLGVHGVNPEIIKLIGSLKYRTSYTQNNYTHSIECGFLAGMMAVELGADINIARRAGLLHDIGKALDHSVEGSHAVIGAEFAKKYGESAQVVHAIKAHHEDEKPNTVYAYLAQAADALSGARPGARRQMMETYVRRLEDLESIGNSFDGVVRTFAIQAGREIRVLVEGSKVTDEQSLMLSRDIARKIERELTYPGQIKVTVIRETRAVEHAR
ncbi:MAG TPA: ribonuclease Y [Bdellovibrionales bacterium]|nr:ribonuclease Y [Bdellovibrionales bacterium]